MTEETALEEYLCPTCLYRDGSCGPGTSYGGHVTSCHAYVLAKENIWCRLGFHDWSVTSRYNQVLMRECRRCHRGRIKKDGVWMETNESQSEIMDRLRKEEAEEQE